MAVRVAQALNGLQHVQLLLLGSSGRTWIFGVMSAMDPVHGSLPMAGACTTHAAVTIIR